MKKSLKIALNILCGCAIGLIGMLLGMGLEYGALTQTETKQQENAPSVHKRLDAPEEPELFMGSVFKIVDRDFFSGTHYYSDYYYEPTAPEWDYDEAYSLDYPLFYNAHTTNSGYVSGETYCKLNYQFRGSFYRDTITSIVDKTFDLSITLHSYDSAYFEVYDITLYWDSDSGSRSLYTFYYYDRAIRYNPANSLNSIGINSPVVYYGTQTIKRQVSGPSGQSWQTDSYPLGSWQYNPENYCGGFINILFTEVVSGKNLYHYEFSKNFNPARWATMQLTDKWTFASGTGKGSIRLPMLFYSNGILYRGIYISFSMECFVYINGEVSELTNTRTPGGSTNQFVFTTMYYLDYDTSVSDFAHPIASCRVFDYRLPTGGSEYEPVYMVKDDYNWASDEYRHIYISESDLQTYPIQSDSQFSGYLPYYDMTLLEILTSDDVYYTSVATSDVGLGGVFTLMGTAFTSFIPLFQIQIIPGITLGLLFFLPLIGTIIIVIIRLVKR